MQWMQWIQRMAEIPVAAGPLRRLLLNPSLLVFLVASLVIFSLSPLAALADVFSPADDSRASPVNLSLVNAVNSVSTVTAVADDDSPAAHAARARKRGC